MLQSYLNDNGLKIKTIKAMKADIKAERLVKGHYWEVHNKRGNGCFVGCVIRGSEPNKFETKLGIPTILAHLADSLFERLEFEEAKKFSIDFLEAVPVGADLSGVWDKFAHYLLVDPQYGVIQYARNDRDREATQRVADLYARKIKGEEVTLQEWRDASAYAYASASAYAYAYASASAYASAYAYASSRKHASVFATYLIKILREAGQVGEVIQ